MHQIPDSTRRDLLGHCAAWGLLLGLWPRLGPAQSDNRGFELPEHRPVPGGVALIDLGAGKAIDSQNIKDPVVGFIFGSKGLMYKLTLEGTKIHKLDKSKS